MTDEQRRLQQDLASQCVRCGLCLPYCPTYQFRQTEAESPRGRIAIANALVAGTLELTATTYQHFNNCLVCRNCEQVCPAQVQYGELFDLTHQWIQETHRDLVAKDFSLLPKLLKGTFAERFFLWVITKRRLRPLLRGCIWLLQYSQLLILIEKCGLAKLFKLQSLVHLLMHPTYKFPPQVHLASASRARCPKTNAVDASKHPQIDIQLFSGCVHPLLDTKVIQATVVICRKLNFAIKIPKQQTCCGALHLHKGDQQTYLKCQAQNTEAFKIHAANHSSQTYILALASGCELTWREYFKEKNKEFIFSIANLPSLLWSLHQSKQISLNFKPCKKTALLHVPCTQRLIPESVQALKNILQCIPQLKIIPWQSSQTCCGAAGLHVLRAPNTAEKMAERLLADLPDLTTFDFIISSNIGCQIHLQKKQLPIEFIHPNELLAQRLTCAEF